MKKSLLEFLNQEEINDEIIEVASKIFLSEFVGDKTPIEMQKELSENIDDNELIDSELSMLSKDHSTRLEGNLLFLHWAWDDPSNRDKIINAFEGAKSKLPLGETAIFAVVVMYGMYLIATGGKKMEKRIKKNTDGSFDEEQIEYESPVGPLSVITKLFPKVNLPKLRNKIEDETDEHDVISE